MKIKSIYTALEDYIFKKSSKEYNPLNDVINRRLLNCFLVLTLIGIIVLPYHMGGHTGHPFLACQIFTACQMVVFVVVEVLVWIRKLKIKNVLIIMLSFMFGKQIFDALMCSFVVKCNNPEEIIIGSYVMCIAAIIFTIAGHLRKLSLIMSSIMFVSFIACACVPSNKHLINAYWYFGVIFIAIFLLSLGNYRHIGVERWLVAQIDNADLETKKIVELMATMPDMPIEQMRSLIDRLTDDQRKQMMENVNNYMMQKTQLSQQIEARWPSLTFTEIEICVLIIKGMTLKEICAKLGKSETTVSSHRSHIRQKLGLDRNDHLQTFLQNNLR